MASLIPVASITAVTATTAGTTVDFVDARRAVSMIMVVNGTVTGGQVAVEASQDGTNWVTLATMIPSTGLNQSFDQSRGAYRYWRASIVGGIKGGGSVTATFMEADR